MDRGVAVALTACAGGLVAMQAPINSKLGKTVGTFPAATVSFTIGLVVLLGIAVVAGDAARIADARHVPWWYLVGGLLGAAYVSTVLVTVRSLGERLAVNTPIQGSAADIIKVAMVRCRDALRDAGLATRLVLQIHDELLFEGPPEEVDRVRELVVAEMCAPWPWDPPMGVDIGVGANWLEAK